MAKKVFIGATGQNCGKTTLSVSLMHLARQKYERVGFMKPIGPKSEMYHDLLVDKDAVLMAKTFGLEEDIALMSPVALDKDFTRDFLNGRISPQFLIDRIGNAMHEMEKKYDLIIIEGAGHGGVGAVLKLNNARVAHLLDAPVVIISESGIGSVIDSVELNLALYQREKADVRLVVVNKLISKKRDSILSFLEKGLAYDGLAVTAGFNYSRTLANPTLTHIAQLFKLPLRGNADEYARIIHHIQLGAASSQRVVDALRDSTLLITTSSRDELIVTLASLYNIPAYKELIAGLVIAGHAPISGISQQILDESNVPYVRVEETTSLVYSTIAEDVAKITAEDQEKINWIKSHASRDIDFEAIEQALW